MDNSTRTFSAVNGLIEFLNATKPYHTHILDVELNYSYREEITVRIAELTKTIDIELTESDTPLLYDCDEGYGIMWEDTEDTETHPVTTIVSAVAPEYITVAPIDFVGSPSITTKLNVILNLTPNDLVVGSKVTFLTSGEYPITNPQVIRGVEYTIIDSTGGYIVVSDGIDTISWTDIPYVGDLAIEPCDDNINSFVITTVPGTIFDVTATSIINNSILFDIPKPQWKNGTQVRLTGVLPSPLLTTEVYYIQHIDSTNMIRLSSVRHPIFDYQYVNLIDLGSGTFQIQKTETFYTGQTIEVDSSYSGYNDGRYNVLRTEILSPTEERIFVLGRIVYKTPASESSDGNISGIASGYSETRYCPPVSMSNMHVEAVLYERVLFELDGDSWIMYIGGEFDDAPPPPEPVPIPPMFIGGDFI